MAFRRFTFSTFLLQRTFQRRDLARLFVAIIDAYNFNKRHFVTEWFKKTTLSVQSDKRLRNITTESSFFILSMQSCPPVHSKEDELRLSLKKYSSKN
ncbi:hypothetical protein CEXT_667771 [Caerostris extrusa]|uniref:Uncharacterized protein n=1 Tax=Caerostris extrusa TaxID=172846 RepID=A0AAV4SH54_CAEEX|nr:hypothetical protein CEXT_667771 [Caerostris extrusa]